MRLIDADKLVEFIDVGHLRHPGEICFSELDVVNMLNHAPAAYEVDNVVEQIKNLSPANYVEKKNVIEIVKGGAYE